MTGAWLVFGRKGDRLIRLMFASDRKAFHCYDLMAARGWAVTTKVVKW